MRHGSCLRVGRLVMGLLFALSVLQGCGSSQSPEVASIKIGVIAPFSGDYAPLGQSVTNGVLLAAEAWNREGGVLGEQIQLVLKDSHCTFSGGRAAAQAAVDEGVLFIIGAVCAAASEGVAQVAGNAGVLQITPASVNPDLTLDAKGELRPLVFRMPPVDPEQGTVAAQYALTELGAVKAGVLYAGESAYGADLAGAFRAAFVAGGGEVVAVEVYDQDAETFYESLEGLRDAEPDVLYMPGYYDVMNRLVAQARRFGLLQPIVGSDGWDAPELDLGVVDRAAFTTYFYPDDPEPAVRAWVDAYRARYQSEPDALATLSYDAADLLFTGIVQAGIGEPVIVAQVLETMDFAAVSGPLSFDTAHNPVRSLIVLRVENGDRVWGGRYSAVPAAEETE